MAELTVNPTIGGVWRQSLRIKTEGGELFLPLESIDYLGLNPKRGHYLKTRTDQHEYLISKDEYEDVIDIVTEEEPVGEALHD